MIILNEVSPSSNICEYMCLLGHWMTNIIHNEKRCYSFGTDHKLDALDCQLKCTRFITVVRHCAFLFAVWIRCSINHEWMTVVQTTESKLSATKSNEIVNAFRAHKNVVFFLVRTGAIGFQLTADRRRSNANKSTVICRQWVRIQ